MIDFFNAHSGLFAQLFGFCAMALGILTYQQNKHKNIMLLMVGASFLWCCHYTCLGLYAPVALNAVNVLRNIVYSFRDRKWAQSKIIPAVFIILAIVSVVLTWDSMWSVLPLCATVLLTIANWLTDTKKLRALTLPVSASWCVYNIINKSVAGTCNEIFVMSSIVAAIFRFDIKRKDKKDKANV